MITEEDKYKITFIAPWGIYCYSVISFSLKNDGATYQRAMNYILHGYMHDIVEDYMDDLIVKIKIRSYHLEALCNILDHLLEYNVQLKPTKCIFNILC